MRDAANRQGFCKQAAKREKFVWSAYCYAMSHLPVRPEDHNAGSAISGQLALPAAAAKMLPNLS
jgi:hypothetical protein